MHDFKGIQKVIGVVALVAIAGFLFSISRKLVSQNSIPAMPLAATSTTPTQVPATTPTAAEPAPAAPPLALDQREIPKTSPSKKSGNDLARKRKVLSPDIHGGVADRTLPIPIAATTPPEPRDPNGIGRTCRPDALPVTAALPPPSTPLAPSPPPPPRIFPVPEGTSFEVRLSDRTGAATNHTSDVPSRGRVHGRGRAAFYQQRAYPLGYIPGSARLQAIRELDQMLDNKPSTVQQSPDRTNAAARGSSTQQWTQIGPQPTTYKGLYTLPAPGYLTSGRVTALAVDPGNASVVYLGGAEGGVWKTTDGGSTWIPLTDHQPSLAVGSIALDPSDSNTIYVGTGEEYGLFEFGSYYGAGVLKSTDGGTTWIQLGASLFGTPFSSCGICGGAYIGSLAIHPTQNQILLAAVAQSSSGNGIYRSIDGGVSWTPVLSMGIAGTEVLFDPTNGNIAYAVLGGSNGPTNGAYKSTDGGMTWTRADAAGSNKLPTAGVGRIVLAMARSKTSTLYAGISDSSTYGFTGLYKSVDSGANWAQIPSAPNYCGGQCPFTNVVAVSPTNADAVFVGGNTIVIGGIASGTAVFWRSLDGGSTWSIISCCAASSNGAIHVDQKAFAFSSDGATLYVGNDGGIWRTTDVAASSPNWENLNTSLALTQFYPGLSIDPGNVNIAFGGTQDNGIQQYSGGAWQWVTCGDGGMTVIDPVQPANVYASCGTEIQKSISGGGPNSWSAAAIGINSADRAEPIYPPLAIDPSNSLNLYFGTNRVYQTRDGAGSWKAISSDLTLGSGTLLTIAVAPGDSNTVYVGTSDGRVHVTTNAGAVASAAWTDRTPGLPNRSVTQIVVDSVNSLVAFVTLSGFSGFGTDRQGHVFQTINGGATWSDISGNLPNIPVNAIVVDPDQPTSLYVATDIGVFATVDGATTWAPLGSGLPRVAVTGLQLHRATRILRAATHGRSMWDLQLGAPVLRPGRRRRASRIKME